MSNHEAVIGILGGMGPYAGLDLFKKIHLSTHATTDQEHLPILLFSLPHRICDRSTFVFGKRQPSPNPALIAISQSMEQAGVTVIGMPCNTAHAPPIFDEVTSALSSRESKLQWVHMIEETAEKVMAQKFDTVGVLSSSAVYKLDIYKNVLEERGVRVIRPNNKQQKELINPVIFDEAYGIKAKSEPVTSRAREQLVAGVEILKEKGAEAVILACTEFPLAINEQTVSNLSMIDPTMVLAHALIRETYPGRLQDPFRK